MAEQMVRSNTGIGLLILTEAQEDADPADTLTDGGKAVPVLREAGEPTGCVLTMKEDSSGGLACENIRLLGAE